MTAGTVIQSEVGMTDKAKFDHSKTKYPHEGRHAAVTKINVTTGKSAPDSGVCRLPRLSFRCHKGEFANVNQRRCEECHTMNGYPSEISLSQHDQGPIPADHRQSPVMHATAANEQIRRGIFPICLKPQCLVCHSDPHRGEVKKYVDGKGCEFCHAVD